MPVVCCTETINKLLVALRELAVCRLATVVVAAAKLEDELDTILLNVWLAP